MDLCGAAQNAPTTGILVELDRQFLRFNVTPSHIQNAARRLAGHHQNRVGGPGYAERSRDGIHQIVTRHFAGVVDHYDG